MPRASLEIAIVGDIHHQWSMTDNQALEALGVDLVLFVGDFGNEAVEVVRCISRLQLPYAAVLGNHDAWYTASSWGRKKSPYDHRFEDRVQQQLDLLGGAHVGYGVRNFADLGLSVVGGRPCSWGGPKWINEQFYAQRYGVHSLAESGDRLCAAVDAATESRLIFLAHNGPHGLGDQPESTCGKDWNPLGGDFGDPDLTLAITHGRRQGKAIPLVTFGHMHHRLRHRRDRLRDIINTQGETLYLNAAQVPRVMETPGETHHSFSLVTLIEGKSARARLVWVTPQGAIAQEQPLYNAIQNAKPLL
ncbi:TIGR04168 family protein [Spirulina sp. CCNP1310]|uniref:TIGR04168 family protein n=1 Tax=Spirulina sp. CCNP1310 TaxID=3110249 RepID=UPI002B1FF722|nr:TIGR04168 family protein [Spirulina sp. CCNP1310]MEA5420930.1 TIGR04168 family protein [Spirulina sp. CCNP1310]